MQAKDGMSSANRGDKAEGLALLCFALLCFSAKFPRLLLETQGSPRLCDLGPARPLEHLGFGFST